MVKKEASYLLWANRQLKVGGFYYIKTGLELLFNPGLIVVFQAPLPWKVQGSYAFFHMTAYVFEDKKKQRAHSFYKI